MASGDFLAFRPLGFANFPHILPAKHSAFTLTVGTDRVIKPVLFPGNVRVTSINSMVTTQFPEKTGYQLWFQPCAEMRAYFFHLSAVSATLKSVYDAAQKSCRTYQIGGSGSLQGLTTPVYATVCEVKNVAIDVQAGDSAGMSGDSAVVDFGMTDFRKPAQEFANNARYSDELRHYVSAVDYFEGAAKTAMQSKLTSFEGTVARKAEPLGGIYNHDVKGTAQGAWFKPASNAMSSDDNFLGLVKDYIDPAQDLISVSTGVASLPRGLYAFQPETSGRINRKFAELTADGQTYCYDRFKTGKSVGQFTLTTVAGIVLVAMPTATTLKIERIGQTGSTCANVQPWAVSSAATSWER
jgi:hypothetical protein